MLSLPTWLRAALITAAQTFVATFLISLTGLIGELQEWVDSGVEPNWSLWAKTVVSALIAAASGVVTAIYRAIRPPENTYPEPPHP